MKKFNLLIAILLIGSQGISAQDNAAISLKNKKGAEVLPQVGDWSFGIAANPFLQYAGNLLNGNTYNNTPYFGTANLPNNDVLDNVSGLSFFGKYVKRQDLFYRTRFNVNAYTQSNLYSIEKDVLLPDVFNVEYVTDKMIYNGTNLLLGLGIEKRKGSGRVQGFYGAELILGYGASNYRYEYGNPMTFEFPTPRSYNYGASLSRVLEARNGRSFAMGGRGFIGVEYFVAPKVSIGGELGYTLGFQVNGRSTTVNERFNPESMKAEKTVSKSYRNSGTSYLGMGLDGGSSNIILFFYF